MLLILVALVSFFLRTSSALNCTNFFCTFPSSTECNECHTIAHPLLAGSTWGCVQMPPIVVANQTNLGLCLPISATIPEAGANECNNLGNDCCRPDAFNETGLQNKIENGDENFAFAEYVDVSRLQCQAKRCVKATDCPASGVCDYEPETSTSAIFEGCCDEAADCPPFQDPDGYETPANPFDATCYNPRCNGLRNCEYVLDANCCVQDSDCLTDPPSVCGFGKCDLGTNQCIRSVKENCACSDDSDCQYEAAPTCSVARCVNSTCTTTPIDTFEPPQGCCNTEFLSDPTQCTNVFNPCEMRIGCGVINTFEGPVELLPNYQCDTETTFEGACCVDDDVCAGSASVCLSLVGECNLETNQCFLANIFGTDCCYQHGDCTPDPTDLCTMRTCDEDYFICNDVAVPSCSPGDFVVPTLTIDGTESPICTWECPQLLPFDEFENTLRDSINIKNPNTPANAVAYTWAPQLTIEVSGANVVVTSATILVVDTDRAVSPLPEILPAGGIQQPNATHYVQTFSFADGPDAYSLYENDDIDLAYTVRFFADVAVTTISVRADVVLFAVCQPHYYGADPACTGAPDDGNTFANQTQSATAHDFVMDDSMPSECSDVCVRELLTAFPTPFPTGPTPPPVPPTNIPTLFPTIFPTPPTPPTVPTTPTPPTPAMVACCIPGDPCSVSAPGGCAGVVVPQLVDCNTGPCIEDGQIGGYAWIDADADGLRSLVEASSPVENLDVTLVVSPGNTDAGSTTTDAMGKYVFDAVALALNTSLDYFVRVDVGTIPAGHVITVLSGDPLGNKVNPGSNETGAAPGFQAPSVYSNIGVAPAPLCERQDPALLPDTRVVSVESVACDGCFELEEPNPCRGTPSCAGVAHRIVADVVVEVRNFETEIEEGFGILYIETGLTEDAPLLCSSVRVVSIEGGANALFSQTTQKPSSVRAAFTWASLPLDDGNTEPPAVLIHLRVPMCTDQLPDPVVNASARIHTSECTTLVNDYEACVEDIDIRRCHDHEVLVAADAECDDCPPTPPPTPAVPTLSPTHPTPEGDPPKLVLGPISVECNKRPACVSKSLIEQFGCSDTEATMAACASPGAQRGLVQWSVEITNQNDTLTTEDENAWITIEVEHTGTPTGAGCQPFSVLIDAEPALIEATGSELETPGRIKFLLKPARAFAPLESTTVRITVLVCEDAPLAYKVHAAVETHKCEEFALSHPDLCTLWADAPVDLAACPTDPACLPTENGCSNADLEDKVGRAVHEALGGSTAPLIIALVLVGVLVAAIVIILLARLSGGRRRPRRAQLPIGAKRKKWKYAKRKLLEPLT